MAMVKALAALTLREARFLIRRRWELLLVPGLSSILAVLLLPYWLGLYMGSREAGLSAAMGLVAASVIPSSIVAAFYTVVETAVGQVERYLVLPAPRWLILTARLLGFTLANMIVIFAAVAAAEVRGLPLSPSSALLIYTLLALFSMGLTGLVLALAYRARSIQGISLVVSLASMVVAQLAPTLFPLSALPGWLQYLLLLNPATPVIEAARDYVLQGTVNGFMLAAAVGINIFWLVLGLLAFEKKLERL